MLLRSRICSIVAAGALALGAMPLTAIPANAIAGSEDDWLTAVCKIGTYESTGLSENFPDAVDTANCGPARGTGSIFIVKFVSEFKMRNAMAPVAASFGAYTTATVGGISWWFGAAPNPGMPGLAPLKQFGFTILPGPVS
jgi:hypothetical protein